MLLEELKDYIKEELDKIHRRFDNLCDNVYAIHRRLDGLKHYRVISYNDLPVYAKECRDAINGNDDDTLYSFDSSHDIQVGDYIRAYDNAYYMGMTKVVKRVYDWNNRCVYLYCVKDNEKDDFVFSDEYKNFCNEYLVTHRKEIDKIMDENKDRPTAGLYRVVQRIVDAADLETRSSVDWWNKREVTESLIAPELKVEHHRPARWEFSDN